MKSPLLLLCLAVPFVCSTKDCPTVLHKDLTCTNDYNNTIACTWNSTSMSVRPDSVCTLNVQKPGNKRYRSSCDLKPADHARPFLRTCLVQFHVMWRFQSFDKLNFTLSCSTMKLSWSMTYRPICHIKLNPPPKPHVNYTTVSWLPQVGNLRIRIYNCELQWKRVDQSWNEIQAKESIETQCDWNCTTELYSDDLILGEMYEARIRVQGAYLSSTWSNWSPTTTWVSPVGKPPPTQTPLSGTTGGVWGIAAGLVALLLLLILFRTDKTTWIYIKKIIHPPIPHPQVSFPKNACFQNEWSPYFTSDAIHSFSKSSEIVPVEMSSTVDDVTPIGTEAAQLEKKSNKHQNQSSGSGFSNPTYPHLSHAFLHVHSLRPGNLEACSCDTPYGPVGCQGDGDTAEQYNDEGRQREMEILQLLSNSSNNSEPMLLVSDYEKVDRVRLQSLDSGVCSGEEVSQESLEADSINTTDHPDEIPEGSEEQERGDGTETHIHKLFGGSGGVLDRATIQVCSGYEQVQKLLANSPEPPQLDSHFHSQGEEQVSLEQKLQEAEKPTESTLLLLPPLSSSTLVSLALASLAPLPMNFSGAGLSPSLRPLPGQTLERFAVMSQSRPVEPSGDGYMPVRQEED
ncbi:uncharacterized protein V6R79_000968 [Siganus canaliculatus]